MIPEKWCKASIQNSGCLFAHNHQNEPWPEDPKTMKLPAGQPDINNQNVNVLETYILVKPATAEIVHY